MSRPPRPYSRRTPTTRSATLGVRDYLPSEYADFLERQLRLAEAELGLISTGAQGDFARTLMDASAVLAHVLGVYQDRHAREAFLGTARSSRSLVRHGRRLGYEPDPGLAAQGFLLLTVQPGLTGKVEKGFAVASSPRGQQKAQTYETLADLHVSAALNEPRVARTSEPLKLGGEALLVHGTGHSLQKGEVVLLLGAGDPLAFVVKDVSEQDGATRVSVQGKLPEVVAVNEDMRLLAGPASRLRPFGWDAPASVFQNPELKAGPYAPQAALPRVGYEVDAYAPEELLLTPLAERGLKDEDGVVVRLAGGVPTAFKLSAERPVAVTLRKERLETGTVDDKAWSVELRSAHPGRARAVKLVPSFSQSQEDIRDAEWLAHWALRLPLVRERPSSDIVRVGDALDLEGTLEGLEPGHHVLFTSRTDARQREVVQLTEVLRSGTLTTVRWLAVDAERTPDHVWTLGDLRVQGNVVPLSHGRSVRQVLGDSEGTQPFLRFALDDTPLTHLPGARGAEPVLEVRVGDVAWTRVPDFQGSDADDRHYLLQRDEAQVTWVVFGDGRQGAIPPAGQRHIVALYRVGLGAVGNAEAGGVGRIVQAHPLVARVTNPLAILGGADPADAREIRTQATRFLRTFDRAVSVQDHADLALLFPGVARAAASWGFLASGVEGIQLVVATSAGEPLSGPVLTALRAFLTARRDDSLPLELVPPEQVDLHLAVYVESDPDYLVDVVQKGIREVLHGTRAEVPGLFTFRARDLGQPAYASEVYEAILRVPGVAYAALETLETLDLKAGTRQVRDVLPVEPRQWLRLLPGNLTFTVKP